MMKEKLVAIWNRIRPSQEKLGAAWSAVKSAISATLRLIWGMIGYVVALSPLAAGVCIGYFGSPVIKVGIDIAKMLVTNFMGLL